MPLDRLEVIKTNIAARQDEVLMYDINIENYERMLARIDSEFGDDDDVGKAIKGEHKARLTELLRTERIERAKAQLALDVLLDQVP
jgi:hypothetical protein